MSSSSSRSLGGSPPPPPSLLTTVLAQAVAHGDRELYTFVGDSGIPVASVTYAGFEARTRAVALDLLTRAGAGGSPPLRAGDAALLVFLPSLDFIVCFVACLRAGVVPVRAKGWKKS